MKPFFPFFGSKYTMAKHYPAVRPAQTVIEPFAGSAAFSVWHAPRRAVLVELDPVIASLWEYLTRVTPAEILRLPDSLSLGEDITALSCAADAKALIGFWASRGSATPAKHPSPWQIAYQGGTSCTVWSAGAKQRIASQVSRVRDWEVVAGAYDAAPRDAAAYYFVDPPYQNKGVRYARSARDIDFTALGRWCQALPGQTTVCEQSGAGWLPFEPLRVVRSTRGVSAEAVYAC